MNMIDCASKITQQVATTLIQNGITHVGRYLPTSDWKGLTLPEVETIKQAGLNLVSIFEDGGTKSSYFTKDQGVKDAYQAYALAQGLGQPEQTAIYFAVDFDAMTNDFAGILNYFQGLKNTLTSYKIGCYGKFEVVQLIQSKGLSDYFWQTYAWSSGQRQKGIHLFQYKNDIPQFNLGFNIDLNQVENPDCGSWGQNISSLDTSVSNPNGTKGILTTVQVLAPTDIRQEPDHTSVFIKNANKGELYNVVGHLNPDWHQVLLDDNGNKGWIDGNAGQNLSLVGSAPSKTKKYTIQSGQTLTKIATIFNTTVQNLLVLNPNITNPNKIDAGQVILVPIN